MNRFLRVLALSLALLLAVLMPLSGHAQVGVSWIGQASGTTTSLSDVVWTGSLLVAVGGDGTVVTSPDGVVWTDHSLTGTTLSGVCWTGTQLVATGFFGEAYTSTDGVTWTAQVVDDSQALTLNSVAANTTTIVTVGDDESFQPIIYTSTDGETWTPRTAPAAVGNLNAVVWTGAQFVVVGSNGTLLTSPNGTTWTKRSTGTTDNIVDIAWNGTRLVTTLEQFDPISIGGSSATYVLVSSNSGTTWTRRELDGSATDVVWVGDRFLVGSAYDRYSSRFNLYTSVDGNVWSYLSTSGYQAASRVVWTGTQAVVVGPDGYIATSDALPNVYFDSESMSAVEGSGQHFIQVRLDAPFATTVTVPFTISGTSTATAAVDYTLGSTSPLTFAAGELVKSIAITVGNDTAVEGDETVDITLGTPTGARLLDDGAHTFFILDDESPPTVRMSHEVASASEGTGTMAVAVDLNYPAPASVSVPIIVSGTADSGSDFTAITTTVNFSVGERSKTVLIALIDDTSVETEEAVVLTLDTPTGAVLDVNAASHTLIVYDDDSAGAKWVRRNPLPFSEATKSLWTGTQLIGWDYGGTVRTSLDGINWTTRHVPLDDGYIYAGAWTGTNAVLIANDYNGGGTLTLTSADGITWVRRQVVELSSNVNVKDLIWTGSQFVAVGEHYSGDESSAVIATSPNGLDWKTQVFSYDQPLYAVQWTGSRIVAVGGRYDYDPVTDTSFFDESLILTSTDGVTWARTPSPTILTELYNLVWTGTTLVASGYEDAAGTAVYTSPDGLVWTQRTMGKKFTNGQIAWTGSKLVAVGDDVAVSTDQGATWTQATWPTAIVGERYINFVTWMGSQLVASGEGGILITSPDGTTWTPRSSGVVNFAPLNAAAWSGSTWVSVGGSSYLEGSGGSGGSGSVVVTSSMLVSSPTGVTWTQRTAAVKEDWKDVVWAGTQFVAVGSRGKIITSADGSTWTARTSGVTNQLTDIAWSGSLLVVIGQGSGYNSPPVILTSPNGITWTKRIPSATGIFEDVVWSGTQFVAIAFGNLSNNLIMTSPNGITWSNVLDDDFYGAHSIASNGSRLVAVNGGTAFVSTNGTDWAAHPLPINAQNNFFTTNDIQWSGTQFVAVGDNTALTSTDGMDWQVRLINDGPGVSLQGVGVGDGALVAVGRNMDIFTSGAVAAAGPLNVRLTQPSLNVAEGAGTVYLQVALNDVPTTNVIVPITITHGTTAAADFTATPLTFTFTPGQTNKVITLKIKQDNLDEADEVFTVGFGAITGAVAGSPSSCLVIILDNDTTAAVSPSSPNKLIAAGDNTDLSVVVQGSAPLTVQWRKNSANVVGATSPTYSIVNAQISHGGTYDVVVKNPVNSATSAKRELGVVSTAEVYVVKALNGTAVLTASTGGTASTLAYQWKKNGVNVQNSTPPSTRITGATTKTLTIKNLTVDDADDYTCDVTQALSSTTLATGAYHLYVTTGKPVLTGPLSLPSGHVAEAYLFSVPFDSTDTLRPATFTATGLPKGLVINAATGVISGVPEVAVTNKAIIFTASNASGPHSLSAPLTITRLSDNVVGTFHGTVARTPTSVWGRSELGARFEMTVLSTGICSGKLVNGSATPPAFTGKLVNAGGTSFTLTAPVLIPGEPSLLLNLVFDSTQNTAAGTVNSGSTAAVTAWRNTWRSSKKATNSKGLFNFLVQGDGDSLNNPESNPAGDGYGSFKVPDFGNFDVKGKLADGAAYATNTFLGPQGQVLIYQVLYANPGSVLGMVTIDPSSDILTTLPTLNSSTSSGTWTRPAQTAATEKVYKDGILPQNLTMVGAVYTPPAAGEVVFGLPNQADNASMEFSEGGIADAEQFTLGTPNTVLRIKVGGTTTPPSPNDIKLTLTVTPSNGVFTGGFTLEETSFSPIVKRVGSFSGIITQDGSGPVAQGYFILPQLPGSFTTPPIWSGQVRLIAN